MKSRFQRAVTTIFAAALLFTGVPASAADDERHCEPCEMCYEDTWFCLHCAERVIRALGGCCGGGEGTTYCVPDYGGFATNCDNGRACQCDMEGRECDPLWSE